MLQASTSSNTNSRNLIRTSPTPWQNVAKAYRSEAETQSLTPHSDNCAIILSTKINVLTLLSLNRDILLDEDRTNHYEFDDNLDPALSFCHRHFSTSTLFTAKLYIRNFGWQKALSRSETHIPVHDTFLDLINVQNEETLIFLVPASNHFMF